ncbi:hypothetical protein PENSPDRAFT_648389 [Peniophora sp. CONT]|nr:hypothetical protein PENSPDRAFT_648389 [Peniophora sp. CONT]
MAPFGLSIGGEKTKVFEVAIQNELIRRGYTTEPDDTMSEYITIMLINNKSPDDILKECISFLGNDVERSFVDWLFEEAARNEASGEPEPAPASVPAAIPPTTTESTNNAKPTSSDKTRPPPSGPRVFQQAIGQAQASTSPTAQKRTASARSPSPTPGAGGQGPNKSRRTDAPTGPRAMRDGPGPGPRGPNSNVGGRGLLERIGPARSGPPPPPFNPGPGPNMMNGLPGPFPPGMNEMEMAQAMQGMNGGPNQQMMFQEMMMNHMALMAQMASGMGMLPPPGMMPGMGMGGPPQGMGGPGFGGPGMGPGPGPRNGPGRPQRGRGGRPNQGVRPTNEHSPAPPTPSDVHVPQLAAPTPQQPAPSPAQPQPAFAVPDRPQSPTLCKFGQKCTNAHCRWSHASPVSTAESGVVLSTEACENGRECVDKDCIKSHVSPAAVNPALAKQHRPAPAPVPIQTPSTPANGVAQCRYGMACTRRDCTFSHPPNHPLHKPSTSNVPCRFGSACTRATCTFAHPADRVLPGSFHKGLTPTPTAGNGGTGNAGHNKSVVFNKSAGGNGGGGGSELERKIKALQEEKDKAEKGIREAEAAKKEGGGGAGAGGGAGGDKGVVAAVA